MIARAIHLLAQGLAGIAGVALVLMMLQTVADVLMSNFFGRPIRGNLEMISVYHMVLVVFLPLAFVEIRHGHITVELVTNLMPRLVLRITLVLGYLVTAGFFAVLAWQTWHDAMRAWRIGEIMMGSAYLTIWPAKFALPVGFAAIILPTLLHAWQAATDPNFRPSADGPADPGAGDEPRL